MVDEDRPTILIFLTDGLPTVGEVDIDRIIDNVGDTAPDNARIFPFGVGYDVDTTLLDTLAENHRGASGYVRPEEAIDEKVSAFYAKVSTPLLADLDIDFGRIDVEDVHPHPLPDLFAGTQLVVVGRYRDGGDTTLTLDGEVNGEPQKFEYDDITFQRDGGEEFIARLWATRKIGYLLQQIRLHGEEEELVDEIVDLSIRYGIITPYTSFLVEETEMALREEGRHAIADEVAIQATSIPYTGASAVERSAGEKMLFEAEALAAPAMPQGLGGGPTDEYGYEVSPVRYVGDKAFIFNEGVWTDTTFDPDKMRPVPVSFGSDDYFALVTARPEWGRYFALGDHVIVVVDGTAYEVREGDAPPVEVPAGEAPAGESPPSPGQTPEPGAISPEDLLELVVEAIRGVVEGLTGFFSE
jgi:Ca-activated chloride channel family protein